MQAVTKMLAVIGITAIAAPLLAGNPSNLNPVQSNNSFGWKLFHEIQTKEEKTGNILISPLSAWLALSLTSNGAEGETLQEIQDVIAQKEWPLLDANLTIQMFMADLFNTQDTAEALHLANAVWVNDELFDLSSKFHNDANTYYRISSEFDIARNEPFSDPKTLENINSWVKKSTDDAIPAILEELEPDMAVVVLNALCFRAQWYQSFSPALTEEADFYKNDGSIVKVQMMQESLQEFQYADIGSYKMLSLRFRANDGDEQIAEAGRFQVDFVLPANDSADIYQLEQASYEKLISELSLEIVEVGLPKIKLSYELDLNEHLKALGMPRAFDRFRAQFKSLGIPKTGGNAYISDAIQKTAVEMDENGFKAAAATAVVVSVESAPVGNGAKFIANRPFFIALRDSSSNAVLFQGIIANP